MTDTGWKDVARLAIKPNVWVMLLLGMSAGLPILLIFSSLSVWLKEAGVERAAITFFSWAALGYSFKFIWAPLVDQLPLPFLTKWLGRRRGWLLVAQGMVIASISAMALVDPASGKEALTMMALAAVALGFSSATQDIVIDAYRIEIAEAREQSLLSATYIAGYRIAMVISGAGALYLATWLGDDGSYDYTAWRYTYLAMAGIMGLGVLTTLCIREPDASNHRNYDYSAQDYGRFLGLFALVVLVFIAAFSAGSSVISDIKAQVEGGLGPVAKFFLEITRMLGAIAIAGVAAWCLVKVGVANQQMVKGTYVAPVQDFFSRYGMKLAILLLLLVGTYRVSDIVLGIISNVFYLDIGFDKTQIASAVKTFGLFMVILGGFVGGIFSLKYGVVRMLLWGAILSALTNLLFILLANSGGSELVFYAVVAADNLSAGLAGAAFVAFLSSLTNVSFTAIQYAIFSSLMTLFPKVLGGYSGSIVEAVGYDTFFSITTVLGLPVILLIVLVAKRVELNLPEPKA